MTQSKPIIHPTTDKPIEVQPSGDYMLMTPRGPVPMKGAVDIRDWQQFWFE